MAKPDLTIVNEAELVDTCVNLSQSQWDEYMKDTEPVDGQTVELIIQMLIPELYESLCIQFYNPYRDHCVGKEGLLVYVHSAIEYFIKIK